MADRICGAIGHRQIDHAGAGRKPETTGDRVCRPGESPPSVRMETRVASIESPKLGTRKWMAVALAVVFAWAAFLATRGQQDRDEPSLEGTGLAAPASFDWELRDLDDAPVNFARFKGRPILLNL